VAEGRIEETVAYQFSIDETLDVGRDLATPVTDDYPMGKANEFAGTIASVTIDLGPKPAAYHEDPENLYNRLVAGQQAGSGTGSTARVAARCRAVLP
jgi:hypothetical protein